MFKKLAGLGVIVAAVAAFVAPGASANGSTWTLNVVHGISLAPAAGVGVCAKSPALGNGGAWVKLIDSFNFKDVRTFPGLPAGSYTAKVVAPGANCETAPLLGLGFENAPVPAGANVSVVAYETTGGSSPVGLAVKVNKTSPTAGNNARLTVYHLANAPAVDVRAGRILWIPRIFANVSNGQGGDVEVAPGGYTVAITPAGAGLFPVVKLARVNLPSDQNTVVYAVGSLSGKTFSLVTQSIPVG